VTPSRANPEIRIGVSSCLLGAEVRYDGGHKKDEFLLSGLGRHVSWVPVCPELEFGLGVPRESLRLVGTPESPSLIGARSGTDHGDAMRAWSERRVQALAKLELDGYVLKKDSPSCGVFRVKIYDSNGVPSRKGQGLFARALLERLPLLPVEEEGRLHDPRLRESFVERVFAHHRWRTQAAGSTRPRDLVLFHTANKMTLMAHSPRALRELGRLVAAPPGKGFAQLRDTYGSLFMETLKTLATPRKHANVLQHLLGFLKKHLDRDDKAEMLDLIERYRLGLVPLIVPITLLLHHARRHPVPDWFHVQTYLNPYPAELMLRNAV
jgi:uncharacterized protein YbgA (DUF1722 family)/uncharacterized protein YbbK (DUF523 family)